MKESHGKGVANHPDPESCVASRKAGDKALTVTTRKMRLVTSRPARCAAVRVHAAIVQHYEMVPTSEPGHLKMA
jgi:hypothetical protein